MTPATDNVMELRPRNELTASTARTLTDSIKADAEKLWHRLLSAYERGVHTALGYSSWSAYMDAEFGVGHRHSYYLLDAGRVARAIEAQCTEVHSPRGETVARELVPLLKQEGETAVAEVWTEVVEEHGSNPTAEQTRGVVVKHAAKRAEATTKAKAKRKALTGEQVEFGRNLSAMALCAEYVTHKLAFRTKAEVEQSEALLDVDAETMGGWLDAIRAITNADRKLRRHIVPRGGTS